MNWLTIRKLRRNPALRKCLLLFFFFFSFAHAPLQLSASTLSHKPLTIKLASSQPVILRAFAQYNDVTSLDKHSFDWHFDEIIPDRSPTYSLLIGVLGYNNYERNPFYTFNTASAP